MIKRGDEIEDKMKSWFKGGDHPSDAVDFQTKTTLYEVKSCNLLNRCFNGNPLRKFSKEQHQMCQTTQLGRFHMIIKNHLLLKELAVEVDKKAKYILLVKVEEKIQFWKTMSWAEIHPKIDLGKEHQSLRIKDIFGGD